MTDGFYDYVSRYLRDDKGDSTPDEPQYDSPVTFPVDGLLKELGGPVGVVVDMGSDPGISTVSQGPGVLVS